jgi:O-antigen ligase
LAIVFTLSRGAWYAVIISIITLIAVFVIRKDFRLSKAKIFIGAAAILVTIYGLSSTIISEHGASKLTDRLSSSISFEDGASNRFQIWAIGWDMFLDAPAIGHGYESFSHLFPYYLSKSDYPDAFPVMKNKTPHNSFMSVLANLGFIGMILFLLIWLSLFKQLWNYFNNHNLKTGGVAWGMALFSFLFIASMVDTSINRRYFWYISALLVLIPRFYSVHKEPEDENSILSDATRLPNVGEDHHLEGKII